MSLFVGPGHLSENIWSSITNPDLLPINHILYPCVLMFLFKEIGHLCGAVF